MRLIFTIVGIVSALSIFGQHFSTASKKPGVHPDLRIRPYTGELMVATDSSDLLEAWIKQNHPDWKYSEPSPGIFKILANGADVPALSIKAPGIRSIDKGDRKAQPEAVPGDFSNSLNTINAAHAAFPEINGTFSKLSVKEKPFNVLDIDLRGRIDLTGPFDEPYTDHATYMATIAAGGGNQSLFTKGGGWKSTITTADYDRLLPDLDLQSKGITVQNHSYGVGIETYYGIESAEYDKQVYENQSLVHIFSSGNKGNQSNPDGLYKGLAGFANITGQFKASKNTISVGSAEQDGTPAVLSSAGPVDDGRIKPELIAIGDAGSSEAAAVVSGIALLVQDAWKKKFGDIPDAAMVKAILINSANDTGTKGPDHKSGYGIANALGALNIINNGTHGSSTIFQNEEKKIFITVPTEIHRLTVTLVWTDPPGLPFATKSLVNDLDLLVTRESDQFTFEPWILKTTPDVLQLNTQAVRGIDRVNNTEQVTIDLPEPGKYSVTIKGTSIQQQQGSQRFHLAFSLSEGLTWTWPVEGSIADNSGPNWLRWQWEGSEQQALLEYRSLPSGNWTELNPAVNLTSRQYKLVNLPAGSSFQFRLSTNQQEWVSETLSTIPNLNLRVGFNCNEEIMLYWKPVSSALGYTVYKLGDQYLEPLTNTSDTLIILPKPLISSWFSVGPDFGSRTIHRPITIDYRLQGTGCYVRGFYATSYLFQESPQFILDLSTIYKLTSIALQVLGPNGWTDVSSIMSPNSTTLRLSDPKPLKGIQRYRARIERIEREAVYSDEAEVIVIEENELFLFPNPVSPGTVLNIVSDTEEPLSWQLFDLQGKPWRKSDDFGPVKELKTEGLSQGIYLLKISEADGRLTTSRIIIK